MPNLPERSDLQRRPVQQLHSGHLRWMLSRIGMHRRLARAVPHRRRTLCVRGRRGVVPLLRHLDHRHLQCGRDVWLRSQSALRGRTALHQRSMLLRRSVVFLRLLREPQLRAAFGFAVRLRGQQLLRLPARSGEQLLVRWELPVRQRAGVYRRSATLRFERVRL